MMKQYSVNVGLGVVVAIAALSNMVTSCAADSKPSAQASPTTMASDKMSGMDHGNMGDGMKGHTMNMDLGPADASFDLRFIDAMTPHHQGAVVMAKEALLKSKRPEILKLAQGIIKAQDQEIALMKQWRKAWYAKESDVPMAWSTDMGHMMAMSGSQKQGMMMSQSLGAADAGFDLRFLDAMIPHHEGAVVMAKEVLAKSKRPEVRKLAQNIIASQQVEIKEMQGWKKAWAKK
jgi:uncharacterized protein (DUF305 family)